MEIEAVQFHFPHGTPEVITGTVDDALAPQWAAIQATGLRLEMEVLPRTNPSLVHITLTDAERGDYVDRLVPNDLDLLKTVEEMIRTFDVDDLAAWRVEWDAEAAGADLTEVVESPVDERNEDFMLSIDNYGDEE